MKSSKLFSGRGGALACAAVLLWLALGLTTHLAKPFIGYHEWGSTIWAQSAHNNLRAGLQTTLGVPSGLYCGPLPIPQNGYFVDHPPLLPLAVTATFALFGEREWAARLVPVVCSLVTVILLWWLVRSCAGVRVATLSAAVLAFQPMELYFGRVVDHEACGLMWILAVAVCLRQWSLTNRTAWQLGALGCLFAGMWTAWPVYILAAVAAGAFLLTRRAEDRRLAVRIVLVTCASVALYLVHIRLVRADAWEMLWGICRFRLGVGGAGSTGIPWGPWAVRVLEYWTFRFSPTAWGLGLIGVVVLVRQRTRSEGERWLLGVTSCLALVAGLWIVGFRNGSYLHSFWSFYFLVPLAISAGAGLDWLLSLRERNVGTRRLQNVAALGAAVALVLMAGWGYAGTRLLHHEQWTISGKNEPHDLVPRLGRLLAAEFTADAFVITNLPGQSMPLEYYAHRNLIYMQTGEGWMEVLRYQGTRCRGLIWTGAPGADRLLAALPQGQRKQVHLGGLDFCLWWPEGAPGVGTGL